MKTLTTCLPILTQLSSNTQLSISDGRPMHTPKLKLTVPRKQAKCHFLHWEIGKLAGQGRGRKLNSRRNTHIKKEPTSIQRLGLKWKRGNTPFLLINNKQPYNMILSLLNCYTLYWHSPETLPVGIPNIHVCPEHKLQLYALTLILKSILTVNSCGLSTWHGISLTGSPWSSSLS